MDNLSIGRKDAMINQKVGRSMDYLKCELCPRKCYVNRANGETGYCRCPGEARVAKTMIHKWERK